MTKKFEPFYSIEIALHVFNFFTSRNNSVNFLKISVIQFKIPQTPPSDPNPNFIFIFKNSGTKKKYHKSKIKIYIFFLKFIEFRGIFNFHRNNSVELYKLHGILKCVCYL